ncbi:helix-turn-helix transcriptional regulator [Brachybacterium alimentarium]
MTSTHRTPEVFHQFNQRKGGKAMVLFRQELGDVLRDARRNQGRTLRQVSSDARVSLGYLSEIERGQKEASSELLSSVTDALGLPLSFVLREVSDRIAVAENISIPDTVPEGLAEEASPLVGAH